MFPIKYKMLKLRPKSTTEKFNLAETEIIKYQLRDHLILEAKHSNTVTNARNKTSIQEVKNKWRIVAGKQS